MLCYAQRRPRHLLQTGRPRAVGPTGRSSSSSIQTYRLVDLLQNPDVSILPSAIVLAAEAFFLSSNKIRWQTFGVSVLVPTAQIPHRVSVAIWEMPAKSI